MKKNKTIILLKNIYDTYENREFMTKDLISHDFVKLVSKSTAEKTLKITLVNRINELVSMGFVEIIGRIKNAKIYRITNEGINFITTF